MSGIWVGLRTWHGAAAGLVALALLAVAVGPAVAQAPGTSGAGAGASAGSLAATPANPTGTPSGAAGRAGERPSAVAPAPTVDPLDRLRERLTRQLGATEAAPGSKTQAPVMRVENEAPGELRIQAVPRPAGAPRQGATGADPARGAGAQAQVPSKARPGTAGKAAVDAAGHAAGPAWSYSGPTGPQAWAQLSPLYSLCERGRRQSPIDIRDGLKVDLEPVQFDYKPGFFSIIDNGHTVDVQLASGSAIELGGR